MKTPIGLIQTSTHADQKIHLKNTRNLVQEAAKKGAQIICLQELFRTPYFPQYEDRAKDDYAETIPGISTDAFQQIARKYQVVVIVPVFEKKNHQYFNSAAVIDADGQLLETYHKIHIPQDPFFYEKNYFAPGSSYRVYKTRYASFAVLICYDQWFPEAARIVSLMGAEIIFYPTAIGTIVGRACQEGDWHDAWETVMRGHAIANAVPVAAVNRVGIEDRVHFWGQSFVCDAFGKVLQRASADREEIVLQTLDLSQNQRIRDGWGFFSNRRPDTYQTLTS